jgi:hypothetical protein
LVVRWLLVLLALEPLANQVPALLATRTYFEALPGGRQPPDELHVTMIRDIAAGRIALSLLLLAAAVVYERRVVRVAAGTVLAAGVLRLLNHAFGRTDDMALNYVGYGLAVLVPAWVLFWSSAVPRAEKTAPNDGSESTATGRFRPWRVT